MQDLDSIVKGSKTQSVLTVPFNDEWLSPPQDMPKGVIFASRYIAEFPLEFILKVIGFNNYREHSLKNTEELSDSIEKDRLLEPIALHYDTTANEWDFIDGEGRFWGAYLKDKLTMPIDLWYDVPPEVRLQMKIGSNSTKTPIDSEDIAKFTKGLSELIVKYNFGQSGQLAGFVNNVPSIKELSQIMHRSPKTVKKYIIFNNLHKELREYVDNNREKNLYSRSIKIGLALPNKTHQRMFLYKILGEEAHKEEIEDQKKAAFEKEGKKYVSKPSRLSDYEFKKRLKDFAELMKEPIGQIYMKQVSSNHRAGDTVLKHIHSMTGTTRRYIDAFTGIISNYPEIREGERERIISQISSLKEEYSRFMVLLPKGLSDAIYTYMSKPPEKSFREKVFEQAELRRKEDAPTSGVAPANTVDDSRKVKAIGEKIVYIPVDDILVEKSQLRSRYKQESIDALVKEIATYGQMKPGLLRRVDLDGAVKYKVVYGHTRLKAIIKAGVPVYKAFIREDLTDLEVSMLQSIEDLSETDAPMERAKVLNKQYNLMKVVAAKEGRDYTKEDFFKDFRHLGSRKVLKDALEFMELDEHLRGMVASKIVGYDASLKIGKLSDEDRLNVLYNVMTSQLKGSKLETYIQKVKENSHPGQQLLFDDIPKSYIRILEQFERESMKPFVYLDSYMQSHNKQVLSRILTPEVIIKYAHIYKSILSLERNMRYKNGTGTGK